MGIPEGGKKKGTDAERLFKVIERKYILFFGLFHFSGETRKFLRRST